MTYHTMSSYNRVVGSLMPYCLKTFQLNQNNNCYLLYFPKPPNKKVSINMSTVLEPSLKSTWGHSVDSI